MINKKLLLARGIQLLFSENTLEFIEKSISSCLLHDNSILEIVLVNTVLFIKHDGDIIYSTAEYNMKVNESFERYNKIFLIIIEEAYFFTATIYFE